MTSEIQWYIARDGKQYGPLSDPEMGLFVKGGHLRPADLVWRAGFADWQPAMAAFPSLAPPPQPPAPIAPAARTPAATHQPGTGTSKPLAAGQPQSSPSDAPRAAAQPQGRRDPNGAPVPAGAATMTPSGAKSPQSGPIAAAMQSRAQSGAGDQHRGGRSVVPVEDGFPDDDLDDDGGRTGKSRLGKVVKVAAAIALLAGGGYLTFQKRDAIKTFISGIVAGASSRSAAIDPSVPAFVIAQGPAEAIDARLQKTALWSVVKREFPDWYGERLAETAKLSSEKKPGSDITKHLLDAIVALRRKHANDALAASNQRLLGIADAFLANLKRISAHSTTTCYSFISQGEASPAIVDFVHKQGADTGLQAQVTAIFEAVAEGRKSPVKHATPDKTDYDALAEQLTLLGWSQADLQLFADPRALARTSHDRVCKMVQDWFSAHIAVKDRAAQERLLIETLRPVVAG